MSLPVASAGALLNFVFAMRIMCPVRELTAVFFSLIFVLFSPLSLPLGSPALGEPHGDLAVSCACRACEGLCDVLCNTD